MNRDDELDRGTRLLVDDLLAKPQSWSRDEVLHRARRYRYHDYKSDDTFCSITLVRHLKGAGFRDLAQNAADGKYDQQRDAIEEWEGTDDFRETVASVESDPEAKAMLEGLKQRIRGGELKDFRYVVDDDGPDEPGTRGQA